MQVPGNYKLHNPGKKRGFYIFRIFRIAVVVPQNVPLQNY